MKRFLFFAALALLSVDGYCHDWANLACYREANDSVMQLDASQREIVLLGNSITGHATIASFWRKIIW